MGPTEGEAGRDPVLGHLDRAFVGVRMAEEPGQMDQNALADRDAGHSLLPRPVSAGRYLTMHSRGA